MSYEKKIKDLMARLASMSPEPPPYPEETPLAPHQEPRRSRPALVFVGAAVLVIALAVPLLMFTGGGEPNIIATTTTTTSPATSTTVPETTTTTTSTTTTVPEGAVESVGGVVFLVQSPENSFTDNPALVPIGLEVIGREIFDGEPDMLDGLAALEAHGGELPDGLENTIPGDVLVVDRTESDGVIVADMTPAFVEGAGGLLADTTMLNQIIYTLTSDAPDSQVLFTVGGEPVEAFGSEGLVLTEPVGRETFIDSLNVIFLTEPLREVENVWVVTGRANTFEAALTVQVLDGGGEVVHEEPTQASCGTGCWGEFGTGVDSGLIVEGESSIRLLTYSAEDGSPANVVTVPIPAGGVWSVTVGD
jgi:Immunoglobulin-like domain of bacterial spore germination/Sporulation and spore germination